MSTMFFAPSIDTQKVFPVDIPLSVDSALSAAKKVIGSIDDRSISALMDKVTFSIVEILDAGYKAHSMVSAIFPESPEILGKTEEGVRARLLDTYSTFPLFEKSLEVASEKMHKGENISVDLYITDLRNPNFFPILKKLKEQADPSLLTIEIRAEDSGILDSFALDQLKDISKLGFGFALNDFTIENGQIVAKNLKKIIDAKLSPKYIKFPESTLSAMRLSTARMSHEVLDLFNTMIDRGIRMILSKPEVKSPEGLNKSEESDTILSLPFFKDSVVATEDILDIDGQIYGKEGLIRFGDGFSVSQGLEALKMYGLTSELLKKVLLASVSDVLAGQRRSLNVFLKDLADPKFAEIIKAIFPLLPRNLRKGLIFEILEDKYGVINNKVLNNVRFLQKEGFTIAIDDLYIGNGDMYSLSEDNLSVLFEENITPDYIKIDGRHIEGIKNGTISAKEIAHLRQVIGYFTKTEKKVTFIMEWVADTAHAEKILKVLGCEGSNILFQGRDIHFGNFGVVSV